MRVALATSATETERLRRHQQFAGDDLLEHSPRWCAPLRPHQVELETWSSALLLPGMLSTEPGVARRPRILHHQRRHGALHRGEAGIEPLLSGEQVARQAVAHAGIDQPREAAFADGARRSVMAMASTSMACAMYWPWKCPPESET